MIGGGERKKMAEREYESPIFATFLLHGSFVIDDRAMLSAQNKEGGRFHPRLFRLANPAQRSPCRKHFSLYEAVACEAQPQR